MVLAGFEPTTACDPNKCKTGVITTTPLNHPEPTRNAPLNRHGRPSDLGDAEFAKSICVENWLFDSGGDSGGSASSRGVWTHRRRSMDRATQPRAALDTTTRRWRRGPAPDTHGDENAAVLPRRGMRGRTARTRTADTGAAGARLVRNGHESGPWRMGRSRLAGGCAHADQTHRKYTEPASGTQTAVGRLPGAAVLTRHAPSRRRGVARGVWALFCRAASRMEAGLSQTTPPRSPTL